MSFHMEITQRTTHSMYPATQTRVARTSLRQQTTECPIATARKSYLPARLCTIAVVRTKSARRPLRAGSCRILQDVTIMHVQFQPSREYPSGFCNALACLHTTLSPRPSEAGTSEFDANWTIGRPSDRLDAAHL